LFNVRKGLQQKCSQADLAIYRDSPVQF
jgi:hypothetical protein